MAIQEVKIFSKFWLVTVKMDNFEEFGSLLNDLQPTSKDGKSLKTALVSFLQDFPKQIVNMFTVMKAEFIHECRERNEKLLELQNEVKYLNNKVTQLEDKIDDQEAYERRDTLIISGKKLPETVPNENCPELVRKILADNLGLTMSATEISVSHRLGSASNSQRPDRRKIIVKFCRRDMKIDVVSAARRVKPVDFYVNESLTPQRQSTMFALRNIKRKHPTIISGTTTIDGSVFAWVKPPNPHVPGARDVRHKVNTLQKLQVFCDNYLQKPASNFLQMTRN